MMDNKNLLCRITLFALFHVLYIYIKSVVRYLTALKVKMISCIGHTDGTQAFIFSKLNIKINTNREHAINAVKHKLP